MIRYEQLNSLNYKNNIIEIVEIYLKYQTAFGTLATNESLVTNET